MLCGFDAANFRTGYLGDGEPQNVGFFANACATSLSTRIAKKPRDSFLDHGVKDVASDFRVSRFFLAIRVDWDVAHALAKKPTFWCSPIKPAQQKQTQLLATFFHERIFS